MFSISLIMLRKLLRYLLYVVLLFVIAFVGLLTYSTLTDYQPEPGSELDVPFEGMSSRKELPDTLSIMIWNIGYCGLGAEMDFFNDGGTTVRAEEEQSARYLKAVSTFVGTMKDSVDMVMIQEVDRNSKRSYYTDQIPVIAEQLPGFAWSFALNYDVKFVPVPFGLPYTPYGKTYGGLVSFSNSPASKATRVQYPGGFDWPTRLYMLDRCALELRYPLKNGKELILVNTHNTAYDATGEIKKIEMEFMKKRYEAEVAKGNKVIIGGDWNQVPPGFDSKHFSSNMSEGYTPQSLSKEMLPNGFAVSYDSTVATNRSNVTAYVPDSTYTTLIDFFLSSPGIEVLNVHAVDMQFRYSDHQPVILKVALH
jgi:endonuclease/exonuclease/phosphatase family metal-dependent hydrolase